MFRAEIRCGVGIVQSDCHVASDADRHQMGKHGGPDAPGHREVCHPAPDDYDFRLDELPVSGYKNKLFYGGYGEAVNTYDCDSYIRGFKSH